MSILIDKSTRVICQGITGSTASRMIERAIADGTKMVGGVTPGKGGTSHLHLPVYNTVKEACVDETPDASAVFVPPAHAATAIIEAIEAEIPLIICVTERVPVLDMVRVRHALEGSRSILVGPNSQGVISPGKCRIGVMPDRPHSPGKIGIISRSATLAYEAVNQTTELHLGQSTSIGIGGDPVHGLGFIECMKLFFEDPETEGVIMIGEIGGTDEEEAAQFLNDAPGKKPVVAYIAGIHAPTWRRMGHAGTVDVAGSATAKDKISALQNAGAHIIDDPSLMGWTMRKILQQSKA